MEEIAKLKEASELMKQQTDWDKQKLQQQITQLEADIERLRLKYP